MVAWCSETMRDEKWLLVSVWLLLCDNEAIIRLTVVMVNHSIVEIEEKRKNEKKGEGKRKLV